MKYRMSVIISILLLFLSQGMLRSQESDNSNDNTESIYSKIEITGSLKNESAVNTHRSNKFTKLKNFIYLDLEIPFISSIKFKALTRSFYDAVYHTDNEYSRKAEEEYKFDARLRELYIDLILGPVDIRLGKQQVVWGEAIGLRITDVVNPQDFQEFILDDFIDSRLPLWMLKINTYAGDLTLECIWIPAFVSNRNAVEGSEWEFTFNRTDPVPGVTLVQNRTLKPDRKLKNSEFGLRILDYISGWDLSASYLYTWDDLPAFHSVFNPFDPVFGTPVVTLAPEHHRLHITGATFAKAAGPFVLHGEFSYYHDKFFSTDAPSDSDGVIQKNYIYYMAGFDYTFSGNQMINLQFIQRIITDYDDDLTEEKVQNSASINIQMNFFYETLKPSILVIYSAYKNGYLISPKISYDLTDRFKITIGGDLLGGKRDDFFGQFSNNDRVYTELKYSF